MKISGLQTLTLLDFSGQGRLHGVHERLQHALPVLP